MATNAIEVHKITQANTYLNGNNMLGKVESVDMPDIKFIFEEFKAMGMVGKMDLPTTGVDKLEGKMKFNSMYPQIAKGITPFKSQQLQLRSNVQVHTNQGIVRQVPLVTFMTVNFKNFPTGKFEQLKNVDAEYDFNCTYFKQIFDGNEVSEYDPLANIMKFNGEDVLKEYRENLGM